MKKIGVILVWISLGIFLPGCQKSDLPTSIYQTDPGATSPVITAVTPVGSAYSGYTPITIQGENFSPTLANNFVYFNNIKATILTATSTTMTLVSPLIAGDSFAIKVAVSGAYLIAQWTPYKLEFIAQEYGGFADVDNVVAMDCDKNENLYVVLSNEIVKVAPDQTKSRVTNEGITTPIGCKIGENGAYVFYAKIKKLYKVPVNGGATVTLNSVNTKEKIEDFDFDQNNNIFIAAKSTIFKMKLDGTQETACDYKPTKLTSIKVYNGYVYSASADSIWRNPIQDATGKLGDKELVFDWKANVYATTRGTITSMTFSENGDIVVTSDLVNSMYILKPTSSGQYTQATPHLNTDVLSLPGSAINWGNGNYLYYSIGHRIIRVKMEMRGAPYYGRG